MDKSALTPVALPSIDDWRPVKGFAIVGDGERVVASASLKNRSLLIRIDLPADHAQRAVEVNGNFAAFVDLRPAEGIHVMTHSMLEDHFQLFDLAGKMVAEWKSKIDEMHTVQYRHPWIRCDDSLIHVARRDRTLLIPDSVTKRNLHLLTLWGARNEERLCTLSKGVARVYDLATGEVVYEIDNGSKWFALPDLDALVHTPKGAPPPSRIYPLKTGAPLLASIPLYYSGSLENDVAFFTAPQGLLGAKAIPYWSPRDPTQSRSLDLGKWRFVQAAGNVLVVMTSKECMLWRWGAATAVRTTLSIGAADEVVVCNGNAYIAQFGIDGHQEYTLKVLPVPCERVPDALPTALPEVKEVVEARDVYRGNKKPKVMPPECSQKHAPLILLEDSKGQQEPHML